MIIDGETYIINFNFDRMKPIWNSLCLIVAFDFKRITFEPIPCMVYGLNDGKSKCTLYN